MPIAVTLAVLALVFSAGPFVPIALAAEPAAAPKACSGNTNFKMHGKHACITAL